MIVQPGYRCPISRAGQCLSSWGDMYEMRVDGNRRFFNMTQRIASPENEEEDSPSLPYALQIHVLPFTTHTRDFRRPCYMVFENYVPIPLPPLVPFVIYFTHPHTLPSAVDLRGLYKALTGYEDDINPRLDIYFLLGATEMDCLFHYRDGQLARGSVKAQISRFRDLCTSSKFGLPCSPTSPGRLPGMLIDDSGPNSRDKGTLFICTEQDWHNGQQSLCQVTFQ
ncbi:hypothetical protein BJX66DRAFT_285284 [Aspergillus keveii]|uniref:Uncharacterized protein n=1 Tax=Aspergillus keveii TaxID=714993 RepID=A0ABR4FVY7_9EURO